MTLWMGMTLTLNADAGSVGEAITSAKRHSEGEGEVHEVRATNEANVRTSERTNEPTNERAGERASFVFV